MQTVQLKSAYKMMTKVQVDKRRRVLHVQFADGISGDIPLRTINDHEKLDLDRLELEDPYVIQIGVVGDAEALGIPWDFARYYCDPSYAKQVEQRHKRDRQTIAQQLRRLRHKQAWTQEQLAKRSGVSRITINRLENEVEQSPRLETLERLAEAFGIELRQLVADEA
ncbi:helix-turn-helix transcriptional regulator [Candidatus Acetothermia bacterium]|nr:helix-turn-helix transcriptional regulator [Candidatus Acetothermia bacterium]